jgi:tetratricopeptide (TPR) repeat protein
MGSVALSAEERKLLLADLQVIYDDHRFLDAYQKSAAYWNESFAVESLSAEEMILAGRLASRVGGFRLSRHIFRAARRQYPDLPVVRFFTRGINGARHLLLDELVEFEKNPELGGNDHHLRASWLASYGYNFATLRDFSRASELMQQAHAISPEDAWLYSVESDVLGMADRWQEARNQAQLGHNIDPSSPWPVLSLATALLNLGKIRSAAEIMLEASTRTQFFQIVQTACWYQCALAETLEGNERRQTLEAARRLAERIEPMSPLADREFKALLARTWLDISELADDHAAMEFWSREARSPFHRKVLSNLKANPTGKRIRLKYKRTIQKHVECVPTSIASALSATGANVSVDAIAREVTFGGTYEWAAADWLRENGFHVRFFSATAAVAARLIEEGIGFVVSWDDDQSGHTVAIVGIDQAAGTVIVHDPGSFRSTEYLFTSLTEKYSPLGVPAMVAVPSELAGLLDEILPPEAEVMEAAEIQEKALALYGPSAARPVIDNLEERFPNHSGTQYLRAIQYMEDGRNGKAMASFRKLLEKFPRSPSVRVRLMIACRSLGNTALLRETLRSVVDAGKVSGVDSQTDWTTPHYRYLADYADLLRYSLETRNRAESLLRLALKNSWHAAVAWHVLGDFRWNQRNFESALLAYRIASTLAEHNEHYARAYADALCRNNRQDEGLEWLRKRAENLGNSVHGVSTWITYIDMLEDWGRPTVALEVCRSVLIRFDSSPSLLVFAVPFLARMGEWENAEIQLHKLGQSKATGSFHEAAVFFNEMRGRTVKALEHAEQWVGEIPRSIQARSRLLALTAKVRGDESAFKLAARWLHERPENEDFEELFCSYADDHRWRKLRLLKTRVKRNPEDAWAWRELAFAVIPMFEMANDPRRRRLASRISDYIAEASRVAGEEAAAFGVRGYWLEAQANWTEACENYIESIRRDPGYFYGYRRAFEVSARFSDVDRRAMWRTIEPLFLGNAGHLPSCLELMRLLNDAFGPRETEQIIREWQRLRPDDPDVAEAMADLLIEHGHGRSDAARALELLLPVVERYPYHSGLRFSLARAYRATGDDEAARQVFTELVRRRPDNISALIQLAWIQDREGNTEEALRTLQIAEEQEPQNPDPIDARSDVLIENGRYDEARTVIADGLRKLPRSVRMYQRAISLLASCGDDDGTVEAARQGVRAYPGGAYLWLLLGRTLHENPEFAAPGEIEDCLRRSLNLNGGLFESADWLAMIFTQQRRYDDATQVIAKVEARLVDPSPALGRKAWIKRKAGEKSEAVTDLSDLLKRFPGYAWGWNLLLAWLEEDEDWESAKRLLGPVPPQMLSDVSFRLKRLQLLEKARADTDSLDEEWNQLLEDFPEYVSLFLHRFDSLDEAQHWDEAAAVLARIAPFAEDDVDFMARMVDVKCRERSFDEALDYAIQVCFNPVEHSNWPVTHVWEAFGRTDNEQNFVDAFRGKLQQGDRPTPRALSRFLEWVVDQERPGGFLRRLRQTRLHHVTREIIWLMKIIEQNGWREQISLADLFSTLNKHRYPGIVVRYWKRLCDHGVAGDSNEWAQAGAAMVNLGQKRKARALFHDWRRRRGIRMWSLANYLHCLSHFRKEGLEEVIETCRVALAQLPHDHCAHYLAMMQAEACALIGDKKGLLETWNERRAYFGGELKSGEYFRNEYKYLLYDIPGLIDALQQDQGKRYRKLLWKLKFRRLWNRNTLRTVRRVLLWLLRTAIIIWVITGLQGIFLK